MMNFLHILSDSVSNQGRVPRIDCLVKKKNPPFLQTMNKQKTPLYHWHAFEDVSGQFCSDLV